MDRKEIINSKEAMQPTGPYSQGVTFGSFVFVAGQTAIDPVTGQLITGGIEAETRQALKNLESILIAAGSTLDKVLKTTVFLKNINNFDIVNKIYSEYFTSSPPARSCIEISAMPKGAMIEIEAIAYK